MRAIKIAAVLAALSVVSCGERDNSGVYVSVADQGLALVQIVQTKDGHISGRIESLTIGPDGSIKNEKASLDGAASKQDLLFKPVSGWLGGVSATGKVSGNTLTVVGNGSVFQAKRSDISKYQAQVAELQTKAAGVRKQIADAAIAEAMQAKLTQDANRSSGLKQAASEVRDYVTRIGAGLKATPDFTAQVEEKTTQIEQIARRGGAPIQRDGNRVAANGVMIETRGIVLSFQNYGRQMQQIVDRGRSFSQMIGKFCASPEGKSFPQECADGAAAAADFEKAVKGASDVFNGHQLGLTRELQKQEAIIGQMRG